MLKLIDKIKLLATLVITLFIHLNNRCSAAAPPPTVSGSSSGTAGTGG